MRRRRHKQARGRSVRRNSSWLAPDPLLNAKDLVQMDVVVVMHEQFNRKMRRAHLSRDDFSTPAQGQ